MRASPEDRFASAKEMALALHAAVLGSGETWSAPPASAKASRAGVYVAYASAALVLVIGGAVAAYGTTHHGSDRAVASSSPSISAPPPPPPIEVHAVPVASSAAPATSVATPVVRTATAAVRASASAPVVTKTDCTTPWLVDDAGIRVFKKECVR